MLLSRTGTAIPHKRPINLSLTSKTVDMAKELGINYRHWRISC